MGDVLQTCEDVKNKIVLLAECEQDNSNQRWDFDTKSDGGSNIKMVDPDDDENFLCVTNSTKDPLSVTNCDGQQSYEVSD